MSPTSRPQRLLAAFAFVSLMATLPGALAHAAPHTETFPLGVSSSTGAVCEAIRDYDDPLAQSGRTQSWVVRCKGFDVPLGHLYALKGSASNAAWRGALAAHTQCQPALPASIAGLTDARRSACKDAKTGAPYLTYEASRGGADVAGEGFAQIADVLEAGVRVVSDAAPPPGLAQAQASLAQREIDAAFGGAMPGLARSADAAAAAPARLRQRGYLLNNEWRFTDAESDFRALSDEAAGPNGSAHDQAEALLNLALNVSNDGRFAEADSLFAKAEPLTRAAGDPVLAARAMNYRALDLRNQGKFDQAIDLASRALAVRAQMRAAEGAAGPTAQSDGGAVVIGPDAARALNTQPDRPDTMDSHAPTVAEQLLIQDAQAYQLIGSAKAAQGDTAGARAALDQAASILASYAKPGSVVVGLRARVQDDIAELDMAAGRSAEAADRLQGGLAILRTRHAGSLGEGAMLFDLAQAEAAAGRRDAALTDYAHAFQVFREQRGSLGASTYKASGYFDLLLDDARANPAKADADAQAFFDASQVLVSDATAQTIARLAARVASGDDAVTGLARALEDSQRAVRSKEAEIARAQQGGGYSDAVRVQLTGELKDLEGQKDVLEQQLLAADPRYGQLVASSATVEQIRQRLRPSEVYAKVFLAGDGAYGLLISKTATRPYRIEASATEVERAGAAVRAPFDAENSLPPFDVAASHALFETLFHPVEGELLQARHLIYEPAGSLIGLPVSVLVTDPASADLFKSRRRPGKIDDYSGVAWLGSRMDSSLSVSAASFVASRDFRPSAAAQPYLGFGDPLLGPAVHDPRAFGVVVRRGLSTAAGADICGRVRQALMNLEPLPETADEVRVVGQSLGASGGAVLVGAAFSDSDIKSRSDLKTYKVLYFATHGILPNVNACLPEPALVTSLGGGDSSALLESSDILNLKLDADLVVLAACDTAGGGGDTEDTGLQGGGEALGGLARAFVYAGARGLIVSHWSVDSASSEKLMTGLFRSGAASQAEGLQRAEAQLMADPRYSHPYYWAPFTIVGDGGRPLPSAGANQTVARNF
jgi:CHAT domain-containing protein